MQDTTPIDAVVIGRNEGARLIACLHSLKDQARQIVYVDSGSTDTSVADARALGAQVVELDTTLPFTAARARNAGLAALPADTQYVQLVDGDCEIRDGWITAARRFLDGHPDVAVVCGRRRERFPEASVYNHLADIEWNTPVGEAKACGGDALMRYPALEEVGFYRDDLIAGEEPELCVRLRHAGWRIWRIDQDMTWHDAQMMRLSQWWRRTRRAGHAFAEGAWLHGAPPERHWVTETRRAVLWGSVIPAVALLGGAVFAPLLAILLIYPLQAVRLTLRDGAQRALYSILGKFAEALGVYEFYLGRIFGRQRRIIEYK